MKQADRKVMKRSIVAGTTVGLAAVGVAALSWTPAAAVTGDAVGSALSPGDITVAVEPASDLVDGQSIAVTVRANRGITLNNVTANQCADTVANDYDFSVVGGRCASLPLSRNHDGEKLGGPFEPGTTTATFIYRVGTGTQDLTDLFTNEVRTLDCRAGRTPCLLGMWIQSSLEPQAFFFTPLTFAEGPTTTTSSSTTTTTTTTSTTSTTSTSTTVPESTTTTTSTTVPESTTTTTSTTVPESTTTSTSTTVPESTTTSTSTTSTTVPQTTTTTTSTTVPESTTTTTSTTSTTVPESTTTTMSTTTTAPSSTTTISTTRTPPPSTTTTRKPGHDPFQRLVRLIHRLLWLIFHWRA
jgi:hypothetical protein